MAYKKLMYLLFAAAVLTGCVSTKNLRKGFTTRPATLHYLLEEPVAVEKNEKYIYLTQDVDSYRLNSTGVARKAQHYIPLLVYNQSFQSDVYSLGLEGLREIPLNFAYYGFLREAERNCHYNFTNDPDSADYTLILRTDTLGAGLVLNQKREWVTVPAPNFFLTVSTYGCEIPEGQATCRMSYKLLDDAGGEVLAASYESSKPMDDFTKMGVVFLSERRYSSANAALIGKMSESFRSNFQSIIRDLNTLHKSESENELQRLIYTE